MSADPHKWYKNSSVRRDPRRRFHDERDQGKVLFPLSLIPYLEHPMVQELPPERREELIARHLYQYLHFTSHLETRVVNRVTERIAQGRGAINVGDDVKLGALQIYCDEGYHSLFNFDLVQQIARVTGIPDLPYDFDPMYQRLQQSARRLLADEPLLARTLQVVVFETLVTSVLNDVPRDRSVDGAVREVVRDHAQDEGYHHAFFSRYFMDLRAQISPRVLEQAGRYLPQVIDDCLRPDPVPFRAAFRAAGLDRDGAEGVLTETYTDEWVRDYVFDASRHTVRLFSSCDLLELPGVAEAFESRGLISP